MTNDKIDTLTALQELIEVVAKLRSPDGGCPWDLAQTPCDRLMVVVRGIWLKLLKR